MREIKEDIKINPKLVVFGTIGLFFVIMAVFIPFDSIRVLVIFILITLMSSSLVNIIYSLASRFMRFSEKLTNFVYSFLMFLFTSVLVMFSIAKPVYSKIVVMNILIISIFIIGGIYIILGLINTGFPKWFRLSNLILGLFTLLLSLIALTFPLLGYSFLAIVITALLTIMKILDEKSLS